MYRSTMLNPAWPHFLGCFSLALASVIGLVHLVLHGWSDPWHCHALLNEGSWLDSKHQNWQPDGCMLHAYTEQESSTCFQSKDLIFIGDSVTRKLFYQVAQTLDSSLPGLPLDNTQKHADHNMQTKYGTNITFIWDPFLNASYTEWALTEASATSIIRGDPSPAMLVLGSGLWYLRYATTSGGMSAWESKMDHLFEILKTHNPPADEVVLLPIGQVAPSKLSPERAQTMHPADIDAMNSDLYHRMYPPSEDFSYKLANAISKPQPLLGVSLPLVFNTMLDESLTDDGLHYSDSVVKLHARILLNLGCNNVMPKAFPMNKTCCSRYPLPTFLHTLVLGTVVFLGPFLAYQVFNTGLVGLPSVLLRSQALPPLIISLAIALIYTADRTGFWLKEQKQFNPWAFGSLCALSLLVGLFTIERGETDAGILNRSQTDEWKGWMQVVVLIYHYFGASKVSGVYNPVRVLVASYLFMTGYGHTMYYLRKADFGFLRIAQVFIRLNLFTVLLAYTMNTDYISYYFTPLVSMWYIVVYLTMVVAARFNDRSAFLIAKILLSAGFMTWFMNESWLLEALFDVLHRLCAIHWSSREWAFRVNLDIWIVFVGMLAAVMSTKFREHRVSESTWWPLAAKGSVGLSVLVLMWFFIFELNQESKFTYNTWHRYISFFPILAYVILRNSTSTLRSATSRVFVFVGKCSLEAFIIQYHLWLAGDSKGVLLVIPGTRWRPLNLIITSIMFLYVCDRVSYATVEITMTICGLRKRGLPLPATEPLFNAGTEASESEEAHSQELTIPLVSLSADNVSKEGGDEENLLEPDTPIRPNRWVDAPTQSSSEPTPVGFASQHKWLWHLGSQVSLCMGILWLLNILWSYPSQVHSDLIP